MFNLICLWHFIDWRLTLKFIDKDPHDLNWPLITIIVLLDSWCFMGSWYNAYKYSPILFNIKSARFYLKNWRLKWEQKRLILGIGSFLNMKLFLLLTSFMSLPIKYQYVLLTLYSHPSFCPSKIYEVYIVNSFGCY